MDLESPKPTVYLCLSHSPLVSHVIKGAMKMRAVAPDDWVLLGRRHVLPKGSPNDVDALSDAFDAAFKSYSRGRYAAALQALDQLIFREAPGGFRALVPHSNQILYQELIKHRLCRSYAYVEEGITSMNWSACNERRLKPSKRFKSIVRRRLCGSSFDPRRPMFDFDHPRCEGGFCISEDAFVGCHPIERVNDHLPQAGAVAREKRIFAVLDTVYLYGGVDWPLYREALTGRLRELAGAYASALVKFHFAEPRREERFKEIQGALPDLELGLLEPDFCIEDALTQGDLVVFGASSLGLYAPLWGCASESFLNRLGVIDVEQWIHEGRLPSSFRRAKQV